MRHFVTLSIGRLRSLLNQLVSVLALVVDVVLSLLKRVLSLLASAEVRQCFQRTNEVTRTDRSRLGSFTRLLDIGSLE